MSKINNFSHTCQHKSNNTPIIILPNVINTHQSLTDYNLAAKHVVVLCHLLLSCWRNQAGWLGEQCPKLDSMLSRPIVAKMVELDYNGTGKVLSLAKDGLKSTIIELEQAKLLKRVLIKNKWYVLLHDQAFKLYLNNNKNRKHRINKGNIVCASWLSTLKMNNRQADFNGALILGEITYFSRVFKRKQPIDNLQEYDGFDSNKQSTIKVSQQLTSPSITTEEQQLSPSNVDSLIFSDQNCNDAMENKANVMLVSKSKSLVAYFDHDHFKKKFPYLSSKVIDRTLSRLEKNNIISVERKKFTRGRKVIKRLYITLNYQLIQKGVDNKVVDFIFKTDEYLSSEQLADFCQNTPPFLYNIYNNKTIIYPKRGFFSNFTSFSSLSSSNCFIYKDPDQSLEKVKSKKWYQVTYEHQNIKITQNNANSSNFSTNDKIGQISSIGSHWSKKRAFRVPRHLYEMQSSIKRHYRAYFASFNYPLPFCYQLLDSLSRKYPEVLFKGENQFITYFRKILSQERRTSWQVKSRKYFKKALSLADLAYEKLPSLLKEKLNQLAEQAGKKIEDLPALLSKLATRNAKHVFSCVISFLSYMKQVLSRLKNKEEIQEAYKALPRVAIGEVASYLNRVEASYHRVGPEEHLRRKLASTLPMTIAYHLLYNCNFYNARIDKDKNFIIPSRNKNWAEMIKGGFKNIIKDQVMAVYGQIRAIKFIGYPRKEDAAKSKELTKSENALRQDNTVALAIKTVTKSINTQRPLGQSTYLQNEPTSYHLFQQRRTQQEQREREELIAKLRKEEQKLRKQGNVSPAVYAKYKQAVEEAELEKQNFVKKWGSREQAKELFKMPSFAEWMQLQELMI